MVPNMCSYPKYVMLEEGIYGGYYLIYVSLKNNKGNLYGFLTKHSVDRMGYIVTSMILGLGPEHGGTQHSVAILVGNKSDNTSNLGLQIISDKVIYQTCCSSSKFVDIFVDGEPPIVG